MSLLTTDYNSGGSDNSDGDNDYDERDSLKLANYAIVSFEISRLDSYDGQYGRQAIVDMDGVQVQHGLAYDRFYSDDDDTHKVFGFGKWFQTNEDGTLAEEVQDDLINKRISEEFGGDTYPYEYEGHVTEESDDEIGLGDMTMWLSNSTKSRTFLKVVTPAGHDVIADKEDDNAWINTGNLDLRSDLEGRRINLFYKKDTFVPDGEDEEPVTYTDAVVLDEKTGAPITIQNGSADDSDDTSDDTDTDTGGSLGGDADELPEGVPAEGDEIIGFMARTGETEPENVEQLLEGEIGEDTEYDLDAVINEIEDRQ